MFFTFLSLVLLIFFAAHTAKKKCFKRKLYEYHKCNLINSWTVPAAENLCKHICQTECKQLLPNVHRRYFCSLHSTQEKLHRLDVALVFFISSIFFHSLFSKRQCKLDGSASFSTFYKYYIKLIFQRLQFLPRSSTPHTHSLSIVYLARTRRLFISCTKWWRINLHHWLHRNQWEWKMTHFAPN